MFTVNNYILKEVANGMNVYDFDKTIYNGDSSIDFFLYCVCKHPKILRALPRQIKAYFRYKVGKIEKKKFKEEFFCFLNFIHNDIEKIINDFWDKKEKKIKDWYVKQKSKEDLIISASPNFLLEEICRRLNVNQPIASVVSKYTGKFESENCYGEEKVIRYKEKYGKTEINRFYTDSMSDKPLAVLAQHAYLIKGNKINVFPEVSIK